MRLKTIHFEGPSGTGTCVILVNQLNPLNIGTKAEILFFVGDFVAAEGPLTEAQNRVIREELNPNILEQVAQFRYQVALLR